MGIEQQFAGKVIMISGATGGFGRALAVHFAGMGCRLSLTDQLLEPLQQLSDELGAESVCYAGDISDPQTAELWMRQTISRFGRVDIAINNAGMVTPLCRLKDADVASAQKVFAVDAMGVFYAMREQLIQMDGQEGGGHAIVNISSLAGLVGSPGLGVYAAAKHAVVGLTKTAALEHARTGIRVNAVCPSFARTPMVADGLDADDPEVEKKLLRGVPMARFAEVEEVVQVVQFACDPSNSFMTGQCLAVDGGISAG